MLKFLIKGMMIDKVKCVKYPQQKFFITLSRTSTVLKKRQLKTIIVRFY